MVMAISAYASQRDMSKFANVLSCCFGWRDVRAYHARTQHVHNDVRCRRDIHYAFASGAKVKHLALLVLPVIAGAAVLIVVEPYRMQRLLAFLDPWKSPLEEGYQLIQSYYALGSGGFFGVGLFASRQKYLFLPFAESDFILSVVGEETGIFGIAAIMILFLFSQSADSKSQGKRRTDIRVILRSA